MAESKCSKCGSSNFEIVTQDISYDDNKINIGFIQCVPIAEL